MRKKIEFEIDTNDIPKLKDELEIMMFQVKDKAYQEGREAERKRIISILEADQCPKCDHPGECSTFIQDLDHYLKLIKESL